MAQEALKPLGLQKARFSNGYQREAAAAPTLCRLT